MKSNSVEVVEFLKRGGSLAYAVGRIGQSTLPTYSEKPSGMTSAMIRLLLCSHHELLCHCVSVSIYLDQDLAPHFVF